MSSAVYYKFKSQRSESRIAIDGTGISVFDLKREIIQANDLGKANDIDLKVYDPSGEEEYSDEHLVPRSSSVVVKRVPLPRGVKSKFPLYLAGAMRSAPGAAVETRRPPMSTWNGRGGFGGFSKRFDGKNDIKEPVAPAPVASSTVTGVSEAEAAAIAATFTAQAEDWMDTQEEMSKAPRIHAGPRFGHNSMGAGGAGARKPFQHTPSDKPVPPGYICYRCGLKGHWIQDCPTNNDPEFDKRRVRRTTGIPRSMLKTVDQPVDGSKPLAQGVMVTPDGGYVIAQPDLVAWEKQKTRSKVNMEAEVRDRTPSDRSLACIICNKLIRDAVKTPCCNTTACEECIHTHMLDHDFACPNCNHKIPTLDRLTIDREVRARAKAYLDAALEETRKNIDDGINAADNAPIEEDVQEMVANIEDGMMLDPVAIQNSINETTASLTQLQRMINDPTLPTQGRQAALQQIQDLTFQLQQAQMLLKVANNMSAEVANASNPGMGNGFNYRSNWPNSFPNQQPPSNDSAYQRLPVNPHRRRAQKRPADWEVDTRDPKMQRTWWD